MYLYTVQASLCYNQTQTIERIKKCYLKNLSNGWQGKGELKWK